MCNFQAEIEKVLGKPEQDGLLTPQTRRLMGTQVESHGTQREHSKFPNAKTTAMALVMNI